MTVAPEGESANTLVEDCEWVDDAVLSISAAFSLCHIHDYAQIEFERQTHLLHKQCEQWRKAKAKQAMSETISKPKNNKTTDCESEGFEATKLAKPQACVLEEQGLDTLGLEVQLQSIQIY